MKDKITYFVIGAIVAVFCTHAYIVYQLRQQTLENTQVISQIVTFLNSVKK